MNVGYFPFVGSARNFVLTTLLFSFLIACSDTDYASEAVGKAILFATEEEPDTRGEVVTNDNLKSMAVFCAYTGANPLGEQSVFDWMHNAEVTRSDKDAPWITQSGNTQWAGNGYHSFMAFAPFGTGTVQPAKGTAGLPTLSYTVPENHAEQIDLLYSKRTLINGKHMYINGKPVSFGMHHALAKMTFSAAVAEGINGIKITGITLSGIANTGTFSYALDQTTSGTKDEDWLSTGAVSYPLTLANGGIEEKVLSTTLASLTPSGKGAFLLPQTISEEAKLTITLKDDAANHEIIRELGLKQIIPVWEVGKSYNYKFTYDGAEIICFGADVTPWGQEGEDINLGVKVTPVLNIVSPDNFMYSYLGKTGSFTVESYGTTEQGTKVNIPWIVEYETAPGSNVWTANRPAWLPAITESGVGSQTPVNCNIQVAAQTRIDKVSNTILNAASSKGTAGDPYDLSTKGNTIARTTSNCYMVNGPGYYKFPLVYGNAINNGATNSKAYSTSFDNNSSNPSYVKANNTAITDPKIALPPTYSAQVVMATQTVSGAKYASLDESLTPYASPNNNVITDVVVSPVQSDGYAYISFRVGKNLPIKECSVQIGLLSVTGPVSINNIPQSLWSWHIWVTPYSSELDINIADNFTNPLYMMAYGIGRISGETAITQVYESRSQRIRFTQTGITNPQQQIILCKQENASFSPTSGIGPYYQFGRKDPFFYREGNYILNYYYYPEIATFDAGIRNSHRYSIPNPSKPSWFTNAINTTTGYDLKWNNADGNVKTVYDPCPPGYKLPSSTAIINGLTAATPTYKFSSPDYYAEFTFKNNGVMRFHAYGSITSGGVLTGYYNNVFIATNTCNHLDLQKAVSISAAGFSVADRYKADGQQIRCIRE